MTTAISPVYCDTIHGLFLAIDATDGALVFEPKGGTGQAITLLKRAQTVALCQFFHSPGVEQLMLHIMRDHLLSGSDAARKVMTAIEEALGPLPALATDGDDDDRDDGERASDEAQYDDPPAVPWKELA